MNEDLDLKKEEHTIIYNSKGEEIERFSGHVKVKPKDYADRLPIEVHQTITETVSIIRMEK